MRSGFPGAPLGRTESLELVRLLSAVTLEGG
jgi:hypothetical protein